MKLEKKDIKHIADLARIELNDKEIQKYGNQLSAILDYIDQLSEVNTDNIEPTAQVTGLVNVSREDEAKDWDSVERKMALEEAPELEGGQVKVKKVL